MTSYINVIWSIGLINMNEWMNEKTTDEINVLTNDDTN
jgi:hypothetical protein